VFFSDQHRGAHLFHWRPLRLTVLHKNRHAHHGDSDPGFDGSGPHGHIRFRERPIPKRHPHRHIDMCHPYERVSPYASIKMGSDSFFSWGQNKGHVLPACGPVIDDGLHAGRGVTKRACTVGGKTLERVIQSRRLREQVILVSCV